MIYIKRAGSDDVESLPRSLALKAIELGAVQVFPGDEPAPAAPKTAMKTRKARKASSPKAETAEQRDDAEERDED